MALLSFALLAVLGAAPAAQAAPSRLAVTVTVTGAGAGTGTIASNPSGIDCRISAGTATGTCSASFAEGTVVTLIPTGSASGSFTGWSGGCSGNANCTLTLPTTPGSVSVVATFAASTNAAVAVAGAGTGSGRVTSVPAGIDCTVTNGVASGACNILFPLGGPVTLTAAAASGSAFGGWAGACSGAATCQIQLTANASVTATFNRATGGTTSTLTVTGAGTGSGTVASVPSGISCTIAAGVASGTCSASFAAGSVVTLVPTGSASGSFTGWSGACVGTANCVVTMPAAGGTATVSATFVLSTNAAIVVAGAGNGGGRVTSAPAGIDCGVTNGAASGACNILFPLGATVTLTATAQPGSGFAGWSGACTGTAPCQIRLAAAANVTATFAVLPNVTAAVNDLFDGRSLTAAERSVLDALGNADGTFNLGDVLSLLDRTGQRLSVRTLERLLALPPSPPSARRTP
ncbi:hypothetical protein J421_1293 [Gemmatirosa kalamazoonensis]|uniref:Bacterial repeat domain-containing protein n=1 Tax=Gemmatirosa kalamazoonensis TaxID=861299 RepID=W0RES7_9BACT|nr:hypothetical protein [Gemmatirosa kalamazoonensis]AHG88830.1 hypothetical protein J421_1293 [Gemmatirosa kalamazoonensis]